MFSSKTLQGFLAIVAFAAISSPTTLVIAKRFNKSDKKSKSMTPSVEKIVYETICDINPPDPQNPGAVSCVTIGIGTTTSSFGFPVPVSVLIDAEVIEGSNDDTVIGTEDFACSVTRLEPFTIICQGVVCFDFDSKDCLLESFYKFDYKKEEVQCAEDAASGPIIGGTGRFLGATGSYSKTADCETTPGKIRSVVTVLLDV